MMLMQIDHGLDATLQDQIHGQIRRAIVTGALRPGASLPSSRELARELGVSRNTAVLAYESLAEEGYLCMRPSAGTFVADPLPDSCLDTRHGRSVPPPSAAGAAPRVIERPPVLLRPGKLHMVEQGPSRYDIDFWYGSANPANFPLREWRQLLIENLPRASNNLSGYGPPEGIPELRRVIADHLRVNRAIAVEPDQVIVTAGAQEGFNLISRLFVRPGTQIAIEDPCYVGATLVFRSYGGNLLPIPVDRRGLCTEYLKGCGATLAYVTPSHQFPTGATMDTGRRQELLDWAETSGAYVVEDDYDSDFRYDGPPVAALAGLNGNSSVIYLGTFSKSIGPGLRTGYMVVPPHLIDAARQAKSLANYGHPWIEQIVIAEFIQQGRFTRHLRRIRSSYGEARRALLEGLDEHFGPVEISGQEAGMHIMLTLPESFPTADELAELAAEVGVGLYPLARAGAHEFGASRFRRSLVLGYALLTPEKVRQGIARVARAMRRTGVDPRAGRDGAPGTRDPHASL